MAVRIRGTRMRMLPVTCAAIGMLAAACGSTTSGQVIGTRQQSADTGMLAANNERGLAASISQRLDQELNAAAGAATNKPGAVPQKKAYPDNLSTLQGERLLALRRLGEAEVTKRLAQIGALATVIQANKHLTAGEQAQLLGELNAAVAGLSGLRDKIAADVLPDVTRTDVRAISEQYRVGGLLDPKVHLLAVADDMINVVAIYQSDFYNLQAQYDRAAGRVTTGDAAAKLADLQARITSVQAVANNALAVLPTLTPQGYPANKPVLEQIHAAIIQARTDVAAAGADVLTIRAELP